ncbi:ROK family transcriptional regulator [Micromonosporaceae bacterium Da 78-11]
MVPTVDDRSSRAGNPGSQAALRLLNEQRVVRALAEAGAATQVEISEYTGLSAATVSNIVKIMTERGIVFTTPTTRSGRRATSVCLNAKGAVAVGVDFGRRHVRVALTNYNRTLIDQRSISLPVDHRPGPSIDAACRLLAELLAENGIDQEAVLGIGVGVPGPLDRRSWTVVTGANLPQWAGIHLLEELRRRLPHEVHLDNDANVGALAQVTWGEHQTVANLTFVKIGTGIGCGLIIGGAPFTGHVGITGEIGHTTVDSHGPVCACGNRGCLETLASTSAMIERLARTETPPATTDDIIRDARRGDPATLRVIEDAGLAVGRALADMANLINPAVIVVGGPLAELGEVFLDPIRRGLVRNALPVVGETTSIVMSPLGELAEVLGAAALVLQRSAQAAPPHS